MSIPLKDALPLAAMALFCLAGITWGIFQTVRSRHALMPRAASSQARERARLLVPAGAGLLCSLFLLFLATAVARATHATTLAIIATALAVPVTIALGYVLFQGIISFGEAIEIKNQEQAGWKEIDPPR